jgi:hypothetical protein
VLVVAVRSVGFEADVMTQQFLHRSGR